MTFLPNPPSLIENEGWRFLILDAPTDGNIDLYLKELKEYHVTDVVRACDPSYSTEKLERASIQVHEMSFPDGGFPSDSLIGDWLKLCKTVFNNNNNDQKTIGVHCVAGLGRAPVLVAIALIEQGMKYEDAIETIRKKRRGAINTRQLRSLKDYSKRRNKCCIA